jgi:restriction endonuclease S subunit
MKKFLIFSLLAGFLCLSIQPLHSQEKKQEEKKEEDLKAKLEETVGKKALPIYTSKGRKDPFKDQFGKATPSKGKPTTKSGPTGMSISTVKLIGIVRAKGRFTAIISGPGNFPMFIKARDRFFDGYVLRIEASRVIFRQTRQGNIRLATAKTIIKEIKF